MPTASALPPTEHRRQLAARLDWAREALRPLVGGESYEARLARRCWSVLSEVASELIDEESDAHA